MVLVNTDFFTFFDSDRSNFYFLVKKNQILEDKNSSQTILY